MPDISKKRRNCCRSWKTRRSLKASPSAISAPGATAEAMTGPPSAGHLRPPPPPNRRCDLHFPAGTYRIERRAARRNAAPGGTASPAGSPPGTPTHLNQAHLRLLSPEHLTLEGEGGADPATLHESRPLRRSGFSGDTIRTLRNLTLDYETPPFTQGRIVAANAERTRLEVEINEGFPSPLAPNLLKAPSRRLTPLSPETRTYLPGTFPLGKVEPLGGRKFRIELGQFSRGNRAHQPRSRQSGGHHRPVRLPVRQCDQFNLVEVRPFRRDHRSQLSLLDLASAELRADPAKLPRRTGAGEPRASSPTNGDGLMFAAIGKVGPYLEHCTFSSMEDDGINLAASTVALTAVTPDGLRTLPERTMSNTSGVLILDGNTGKVKAVRRIVRRNGHPEYATPLPPGIATRETLRQPTLTEDQKREQKTMYLQKKVLRPDRVQPLGGCFSGSAIVNCTYRNVRGLGVQLTAPGVRVE